MQEKLPLLALLPWRVVLIRYWYCTDSVQQLMLFSLHRNVLMHSGLWLLILLWFVITPRKSWIIEQVRLLNWACYDEAILHNFWHYSVPFWCYFVPCRCFLLPFYVFFSPFVVFYTFLRLFVAKSEICTFLGAKLSKADKSAFF